MKAINKNLPSTMVNILAGLLADILLFASFCYRYGPSLSLSFFNCTVIIHAYLIRNVLYCFSTYFNNSLLLCLLMRCTQVKQLVTNNIISISRVYVNITVRPVIHKLYTTCHCYSN